MPTAKKTPRKTAHHAPEEELHQHQEQPAPVAPAAPSVPTADGWYQANMPDGAAVMVAVTGGRYFLHWPAIPSGCREVDADAVAHGYFSDWKQVGRDGRQTPQ